MVQVKIKLNGGIMPKKATEGAAAYDLYAPEDVEITERRQVINLRFSMELPEGYAATIQPRSGFSAKGIEVEEQITMLGTVESNVVRYDGDVKLGLIDEDYRGEVGVIIRFSQSNILPSMFKYVIKKGTRIAQMRIVEAPKIELVEVEELSDTERGKGGFGSTGTK